MKSWYLILWRLADGPTGEYLRWIVIVIAAYLCIRLGIHMDEYDQLIQQGKITFQVDTVHTIRKMILGR
ncbi:hypothetical protein [Spirosoma harenae]